MEHTKRPAVWGGVCLYCNHCLPCPEDVDIGLVNRLLDQAEAGDSRAWEAYGLLERHAGHCIGCGECERRCRYHVPVGDRMREAREFFTHRPDAVDNRW